jgi:hypothetical protein
VLKRERGGKRERKGRKCERERVLTGTVREIGIRLGGTTKPTKAEFESGNARRITSIGDDMINIFLIVIEEDNVEDILVRELSRGREDRQARDMQRKDLHGDNVLTVVVVVS